MEANTMTTSTSNPIIFAAPAKLNLFLHVVGRREDGYHLLQTAFQLIDRCDTVEIEIRTDCIIKRRNDIPEIKEENDLVIKAARLLQEHTSCEMGANITLNKILPTGGGLGGGSSDAASTLIALNHLWQCGLTRVELMKLGLQLGADVPFFIFGQNAFAEGIGEQLQAINTKENWFVVIEPGIHVPTSTIFSSKELTRNTNPVKISDFSSDIKNQWKNDLQDVACALFPEVEKAIKWLNQFGKAKMTGSGACVFCEFSDKVIAENVVKQVPKHWISWKAKTLQIHPLSNLLIE
jgi:4-diphosphocytidyl-2-C-methyl-D-erythritol kinase